MNRAPVTIDLVRAGRPEPIGTVGGHQVSSAIAKRPVTEATITVGRINLSGDDQADRTVHGGPDKSVYVYPSAHYAAWLADGFELGDGGLGENLALSGADERDVRIGSVWAWGDAVVQVSQPRTPCFKLALHTGRRDLGRRMIETVRTGWYLRTLRPGTAPTAGPLHLVDGADANPTVAETFLAGYDPATPLAEVRRVVATAELADQFRSGLAARWEVPV